MEAVAEHINEMQKIYEEYGSTFDELSKHYRDIFPHSKVSGVYNYVLMLCIYSTDFMMF